MLQTDIVSMAFSKPTITCVDLGPEFDLKHNLYKMKKSTGAVLLWLGDFIFISVTFRLLEGGKECHFDQIRLKFHVEKVGGH